MARGQLSKKSITDKILSTFEGSFLYNDGKEIRIPILEDGEIIQIKVTLTAAKTNVEPGDDIAIPGVQVEKINSTDMTKNVWNEEIKPIEPTAEEKQNVKDLLSSLGL